MSIEVHFRGWEQDSNSAFHLFWLGTDKSVSGLIRRQEPIPADFVLTLNERGYYRIAAMGLHELAYVGMDITPAMFDDDVPLVIQAKRELFDITPQDWNNSPPVGSSEED